MGVPSGYTSAQVVQAVPTGINSALVLISSTTIGSAVTSVAVTNAFSSTYDNYRITINGGVSSTNTSLRLTFGATATGYYWGYTGIQYDATSSTGAGMNQTNLFAGSASTTTLMLNAEVMNPFLTEETIMFSHFVRVGTASTDTVLNIAGFLNDTTSYTAFTIAPATGTLTGGTIRVYGYLNS